METAIDRLFQYLPQNYINTLTVTLVVGDRSAWTYNCKNWMKIDSLGILNIIDK